MCSYFNPDCLFNEEYEACFKVCTYNTYLGSSRCPEECINAGSCEDCPNLIEDSVTAYRCRRNRCAYLGTRIEL